MSYLGMSDVRAYNVPPGSMTIWWLGQGGFLLKSPAGKIMAIDPYLSNSCKPGGSKMGLDLDRLLPVPLSPGDLMGIDLYVLTHSHQDHLDPETIEHYRQAGGAGPYLAPPEAAEKLESLGVPEQQIMMTWPNKELTLGDVTVRTAFAIPFGGDDLTHVGYIIRTQDGPTMYITGDTDYNEILASSVGEHAPDVMLTVINGAYRNLGVAEAARLAKQINPEVVIPYHYGMFRDNTAMPETFRTELFVLGIRDKCRILELARPYTFPEM